MNTKELDNKYVAGTYGRFDVAIKSGKGSTLYDEDGKEYIDFGSGIAVNTFGASDDVWKQAIISQLDKIQHTSNLYYNENGRRVYFMEDRYGERGNLMPRDVVAKCIYDAPSQVYLDIAFLGKKIIESRLLEVAELCKKYATDADASLLNGVLGSISKELE